MFSRIPNSSRAPKLTTIAQSFFKSGLPFAHNRALFMDEDLDENHMEDDRQHQSNSEFSQFVNEALDDAMKSLYPESKAMTFPRFLANNKYFETLRVRKTFVTDHIFLGLL